MATSLPGSLKAGQDANLARFTTHALLPIFPDCKVLGTRMNPGVWTGKFDLNTDTSGRENFFIRKEKVADSKNIWIRVDGAYVFRS